MILVDSNVSAATSGAWFLSASNVTACSIVVHHTWLSVVSNAFEVQQSVVNGTNVTLVNSSLSVLTHMAMVLFSSNVTACRIVVQCTWLTAVSNTLQVQQSMLTATIVVLVESDVFASTSAAWFLISSNVTACRIVVQRTSLTAASNTLQVQQSALTATNVVLLESNVSAATSGAWVLSVSNVTACSIVVHHTSLSAARYTFTAQQVSLTTTSVTLMDSSVSAETTVAWFLVSVVVVDGSIVVQRTWLSAARNAFQLQQSAVTATNVTLVDSSVCASTSVAWFVILSNVTACRIVVQRTLLTAASNTLQVQQSALTATNVVLLESNVSAATSGAWVLSMSNVTACSIVVQRTSLTAASNTFHLQQTALTGTSVTLMESSGFAAASGPLIVSSSNVTACSIFVYRSLFVGGSFVFGLRNTAVTNSHVEVRSCSFVCTASGDELSGAAMVRVATSSIANSILLLQSGSISVAEGGSVLRVVNSSVMVWSLRVVDMRLSVATSVSSDPLSSRSGIVGDTAAMVAFEHSDATDVDIIVDFSSITGFGMFLLCNRSRVELETFVIAESNISTPDGEHASASLVRAMGSGTTYIHNVTVERSRFAGFMELFGASGASSLSIADSAYRCSWWSSAAAAMRWRPLTKLHLGIATFERLPAFSSGGSDRDAACGAATVSVSASGTATALELSGSRSMLLSSSKTLVLTASGGTASCTRSGTTTTELTLTPIVAQRVVQVVVDANVESAALIGVAIAATSFSVVRAGLTGQRVAFVLRSAGRKCAVLDDDSTAVEVDGVDWLSSPTRLSVGSGAAAAHRGAVLGNIGVCAGAALLAAVTVGCVVLAQGRRATAAMSAMHVRHVLCVPVMLLLEPTMASSVTLMVEAAGATADVAVGTAGVVCVVGAVFVVARVLDPRRSCFLARAEALPRVPLARGAWRWWTAACVVWRPKAGSGRFVLDWGFLFDDSRGERHWWALVDMGVAVAMGGLSSAAPATRSSCAVWKWVIVAVACGGVVMPLVLVPLSSARAMCECVTMAALTALIAVLGAVDAEDAAVEGIGVLAAVLQWASLALHAVAHLCALQVRHVDDEVSSKVVLMSGFSAMNARGGRAESNGVLAACHSASAASNFASLPRLVHTASAFLRPQVSERRSAPRALRREAFALRALVSLICIDRNRKA